MVVVVVVVVVEGCRLLVKMYAVMVSEYLYFTPFILVTLLIMTTVIAGTKSKVPYLPECTVE